MKFTLPIAVCVLVVLLQEAKLPLSQSCADPTCLLGYALDAINCECSTDRPATCPSHFIAITLSSGICACRKKDTPTCPSGWSLNTDSCQCEVDQQLSCPAGSTLTPSTARCTGTTKPTCPEGASQSRCKCAENILCDCTLGELSLDGCFCSVTSTPQCSTGCELNENLCTCNPVMCYSRRQCSGALTHATSGRNCCRSRFWYGSYQTSTSGPCYNCHLRLPEEDRPMEY